MRKFQRGDYVRTLTDTEDWVIYAKHRGGLAGVVLNRHQSDYYGDDERLPLLVQLVDGGEPAWFDDENLELIDERTYHTELAAALLTRELGP